MKQLRIVISIFTICILTTNLYSQELFKYDSNNSNLLSSGLRCLAVDSSNVIWLGAQGAAYSFVKDNWIKIDSGLDLKNDEGVFVTDIEVSPNGDIWFSLGSHVRYGEKLFLKRDNEWSKSNLVFSIRYPINIFIENDTTLYLTLYNYWPNQLGENTVGILQREELIGITPEYVFGISSAIPISKDTLMLSSWEGISIYDGDTSIVNNPSGIELIEEELGLTKLSNRIFVYAEWLYEYENSVYISYPQIDSILAIDSSKITCMSIDGDNTLWLGTNDGKLIRYDQDNIDVSELVEGEIMDLAIDKYGNKWFIIWEGCFVYNENKVVGVEDDINDTQPNEFSLLQNYPNPFNPSTTIKYSIPNAGNENFRSLQLKVYDILGREVTTLVNKEQKPGTYEVQFNGNELTSGIYFYRLQSGDFTQSLKMILLK